jgi:hypothetical protein
MRKEKQIFSHRMVTAVFNFFAASELIGEAGLNESFT